MIAEDLGAERDGVTRTDGAIRPDLKRQLVEVGHVAHAGVFHGVVDLVHGRVDRVNRNDADGSLRGLVAVGGHIAAAVRKRQLHVERRTGVQRCDVQVGVEDLDLAVALDVAGLDLARAHSLNIDGLDAVGIVQTGNEALDVQHDLSHILHDTGDGGELVLHAGDLDRGRRGAGQGREHNAAQRIAERDTVAALKRLYGELAVGAVRGVFHALDLGLFNFNHAVTLHFHSVVSKSTPKFCVCLLRARRRLLGVQLNDEVLLNGNINFFAGGKANHGALEAVLIALHPGGDQEHGSVLTHQALEDLGRAAALRDLDHIAGLDEVGRNVDLLAVDGEVRMADELTGLTAGHRKAHAVNNVIQTALDRDEQVVTGLAGGGSGGLIVTAELLFEDTIDELDLLLFSKLKAVFALLLSHLAAGVAISGLLRVAHHSRRNAQSLAALGDRLHILCHSAFYLLFRLDATALRGTAAVVRDGRDVLDHRDLQADSLQGADRSFTTLAGALNKDLDRLETMLHRSGSSRFSGALSGERSGLLAAAEAEAAGGSPGKGVALRIGHRDHGVVEGGTNMNLTTFDVLLFAATADNLLTGFSIVCCHILFSLLTSSCSQWSSWGPCGYERWSCCADRERAGRGDDGCRDSSRSRSDA